MWKKGRINPQKKESLRTHENICPLSPRGLDPKNIPMLYLTFVGQSTNKVVFSLTWATLVLIHFERGG